MNHAGFELPCWNKLIRKTLIICMVQVPTENDMVYLADMLCIFIVWVSYSTDLYGLYGFDFYILVHNEVCHWRFRLHMRNFFIALLRWSLRDQLPAICSAALGDSNCWRGLNKYSVQLTGSICSTTWIVARGWHVFSFFMLISYSKDFCLGGVQFYARYFAELMICGIFI